jgi:hypothetical protein
VAARLRESPHHGLHIRHEQLQGVFAWNVKGKRHSTCNLFAGGSVYVDAPPATSGIASVMQFAPFTVLVVDAHQRGRPVAWALLGGNERIENMWSGCVPFCNELSSGSLAGCPKLSW